MHFRRISEKAPVCCKISMKQLFIIYHYYNFNLNALSNNYTM